MAFDNYPYGTTWVFTKHCLPHMLVYHYVLYGIYPHFIELQRDNLLVLHCFCIALDKLFYFIVLCHLHHGTAQ